MKRFGILLLLLAILTPAGRAFAEDPAMNEAKPKTAVMIIANQNFRDEEFAEPHALLSAAGVKVSRISSLENDIAMAMSAVAVRIKWT